MQAVARTVAKSILQQASQEQDEEFKDLSEMGGGGSYWAAQQVWSGGSGHLVQAASMAAARLRGGAQGFKRGNLTPLGGQGGKGEGLQERAGRQARQCEPEAPVFSSHTVSVGWSSGEARIVCLAYRGSVKSELEIPHVR